MGIASGMKELTQDIASSHEDREKKVGEIREGTKQTRREAQDLVKGFETHRKEASVQQRANLAQDKSTRGSEVKQMRTDFGRDQEELRAELKEASAAWHGLTSTKAKRSKKQRKEV